MTHPKYKNIGTPLARLVEEIGGLLQAVSKGERFGWDNTHPKRNTTNLEELENEWADLNEAYDRYRGEIP